MFKININFAGLLSVFKRITEIPSRVKSSLTNVINQIGEALVDEVVDDMSAYSGLSAPDLKSQMTIQEATDENQVYEMDASVVVPDPTEWARPWTSRDKQPFDSNILVNIITMGDDKVCPICVAAARNNPYTLAETNKMFAKWLHVMNPGLLHPNCRCTLEPTDMGGRKPFGTGGRGGGGMPSGLMSMRTIGNSVADSLIAAIKK